ncbi:uncharacterized protein EI90DRAFT_3118672 [Cantharellus anzutake]|uniref:uncharacterized protein n=1 Tax=Cantharellus anzutake TaxID=1750568 RepID=UPI001906E1B0|nr:uncharacterized protein EI90DRAFT_3118672 [Cantharellus anzutake]KAF8338258.1 hypothetical protein EI90DRAFT_3118672 [Cantharellus anzutake]
MTSTQPAATPTPDELDAFATLQHHLFTAVNIAKSLSNRWHVPMASTDPSPLNDSSSSPSLPFSPARANGDGTRKPIYLPPPRMSSPQRRYPLNGDPSPRQSTLSQPPFDSRGPGASVNGVGGPNTASRFTTIDREEGYAKHEDEVGSRPPSHREEAPRGGAGRSEYPPRPPYNRPDDVEMSHPPPETMDTWKAAEADYRRYQQDMEARHMEHSRGEREDFVGMKGGRNNSNQHGQQRDTMVHRRPLPLPIPKTGSAPAHDGPPPPPPPPGVPAIQMIHVLLIEIYLLTFFLPEHLDIHTPCLPKVPMHALPPHLHHSHPYPPPHGFHPGPITNPDGTLVHSIIRPPITPATPGRRPASAITINAHGQRTCKQCGQPGRYKDGRCIEKWGPGPSGPGTVCDRCRKRMKRVERRNLIEAQLSREPAPHVHLTNPTLTPIQVAPTAPSPVSASATSAVNTPVEGEGVEEDGDELDERGSVIDVDESRSRSPSTTRGRRSIAKGPSNSATEAMTTSGNPPTFLASWSKHNASHHGGSTTVKVSSERSSHPLRSSVSGNPSGLRGRGRRGTESDSDEDEDGIGSERETRRAESDGESGSVSAESGRRGGRGGDEDGEEEGDVDMEERSVPSHNTVKTSPRSIHSLSNPHPVHPHPHSQSLSQPRWGSRTSPTEGLVDSGSSTLADSDAVTGSTGALTAVTPASNGGDVGGGNSDSMGSSSPASPAAGGMSSSLAKVLGKRRSPSAIGEREVARRKLGVESSRNVVAGVEA